jgi:dTDP-4-amino-4,6-dideoxygalactose transaminase
MGGSWRYDVVTLGYKYNMTDLAAAVGLAQAAKFRAMQAARRRLAKRYDRLLGDAEAFDLPARLPGTTHAWHLYVLRLRPGRLRIDRDRLIERLRLRGVGTSVHFLPLHLHSYYRNTFGYRPGAFPRTERESARALSLPLYPGLTRAAQDRVAGTLIDLARRFGR